MLLEKVVSTKVRTTFFMVGEIPQITQIKAEKFAFPAVRIGYSFPIGDDIIISTIKLKQRKGEWCL